jgi:hypothetical protein
MKQQKKFDMEIKKSATLSDCKKYRYCLTRIWDDKKPVVLFIMLNPSTADEEKDDATIRRCMKFSDDWGFGGLYVINLFAFRATKPEELLKESLPVGSENEHWFKEMNTLTDKVICAWGNGRIVDKIQKAFPHYKPLRWIKKPLHYLELSKDGTPKHPLYLLKSSSPKLF